MLGRRCGIILTRRWRKKWINPNLTKRIRRLKKCDFKPKLENESGRIVIGAALDEIAEELEKGRDSV